MSKEILKDMPTTPENIANQVGLGLVNEVGSWLRSLERRAVSRALTSGGAGTSQWPGVPHWRERRVPSKVAEPMVEAQ